MSYEQLKKNYERGLWNVTMVSKAVEKCIITVEQFNEITGQAYSIIGGAQESSPDPNNISNILDIILGSL